MYTYLSRHLLYPIYETVTGRNILEKVEFLDRSQWWDPKKLQEYQWRKLKTLVKHAYDHVPFYRRYYEEFGFQPDRLKDFSDFNKIPLLTKDQISKNLPDLVSKDVNPAKLLLDTTSGSTGRNLVFYNDRNTLDWMTAAVLRNMAWYNLEIGDKRVLLWGQLSNESWSQKVYTQLRNLFLREYIVSSYELNQERLSRLIDELKKLRPKALIGYVSALEILARFIQERGILDLRLPAVVPAAETLFEHQRALFKEAFQGEVFNRYGCHEFNGISHECAAHEGMHINAENLYVEILKDGRNADPGDTGEIVITDLQNFGAPFIRYRIEDLGRFGRSGCGCGRGLPLLESVEGRVYDLIACPNGTVQTGTFFCKITRSVDGIREFQVVQESGDAIRLKLVTDDTFQADSVLFLEQTIKAHCGSGMRVIVDFVSNLEPLKSGKRRYVVSLRDRERADSQMNASE